MCNLLSIADDKVLRAFKASLLVCVGCVLAFAHFRISVKRVSRNLSSCQVYCRETGWRGWDRGCYSWIFSTVTLQIFARLTQSNVGRLRTKHRGESAAPRDQPSVHVLSDRSPQSPRYTPSQASTSLNVARCPSILTNTTILSVHTCVVYGTSQLTNYNLSNMRHFTENTG